MSDVRPDLVTLIPGARAEQRRQARPKKLKTEGVNHV